MSRLPPETTGNRATLGPMRACVTGLMVVLIVGLAASPALSKLRPGLSLSKAIGSVERSYPDPLIGTESSHSSGGVVIVTLYPAVADCANPNRTTCDTIDFDLSAPAQPDSSEPFSIKFTLTWKGTSNDLDFTINNCTNQTARTGCTRLKLASGGNAGVEVTGLTNPEGKRYFITVVNMSGLNDGYHFKAEWLDGKRVDFAKPQPKPSPTSGAQSSTRAPGSSTAASTTSEEEEEEKAKLQAARSPGADGPLSTTEIAALRRESQGASEGAPWRWLALGLVLALGLAGALILVRRRRRAARGEAGQ